MNSRQLRAVLMLVGAALALVVFVWSIFWPKTGPKIVTLVGGPMIQLGNLDTTRGVIITWRTKEKTTSRLELGFTPAYGYVKEIKEPTDRHVYILNDLWSNARYYYAIASDNQVLAASSFKTAAEKDHPFRFAVFGDSGGGAASQYGVAQQVLDFEPRLVLHTGDLVYSQGADEDYPEKFYRPYRDLIKHTLFFPSLGNHDYNTENGQPLLDNFFLPGNERYYSFDYYNAHFIALDSNQIDERQTEWLKDDLAATAKKWKFVFFHEPPFSNKVNRDGSEPIRRLWIPIFSRHKVDMVFCGHDHLYARFKQIDGVTYIVEGVGGKNLYETKEHPDIIVTDNKNFGFGLVEVSENSIVFRHVTIIGHELDRVVIEK